MDDDWSYFGFEVPDKIYRDPFGTFNYSSFVKLQHDGNGPDIAETYSPLSVMPIKKYTRPQHCSKEITTLMTQSDHLVVDEVFKQLTPEMLEFLRPLIPLNEDLLDTRVVENRLRHGLLRDIECNFRIMQKDDLFLVDGMLYSGDSVVCKGCPLDIMEFTITFHRSSAHTIFSMLRHFIDKKTDWDETTYIQFLELFRRQRALAPSINKFSKVSQLEIADSDNPFYWFSSLDDDGLGEGIDFIGFGNFEFNIRARFPLSNFHDCVVPEPFDRVLVVNCVSGDTMSSSGNNKDFLKYCVDNCRENLVVANCYLEGLQGFDALLVCKPRPHNLTAILQIGEGIAVDELVRSLIPGIQRSNEWRNDRLLGRGRSRCKSASWRTLEKSVSNVVDGRFVPRRRVDVLPDLKPIDRGKVFTKRNMEILDIQRDKNFVPVDMVLPKYLFQIHDGNISLSDPGIGSARMAISGVFSLAKQLGRKMIFDGNWKIQRN